MNVLVKRNYNKNLLQILSLVTLICVSSCKLFNKEINTEPEAFFTIEPKIGNTETNFNFDASVSIDDQDSNAKLQVRWDWENDGKWDTNFSNDKTNKHKYSSSGQYSIKLEVKDSEGLLDDTIEELIVNNLGPVAVCTVSPVIGTILTDFNFDASASTDDQDSEAELQIRWDWENDGTWDTNYSTLKNTNHRYNSLGNFNVKLEVLDSEGETDDTTITVAVENGAPICSVTANPTIGFPSTIFNFDASTSSDDLDDIADLRVRWDWENNGIWNIGYTTSKEATYQFNIPGDYTVATEIIDTGGLSDLVHTSITVTEPDPVIFGSGSNFGNYVEQTTDGGYVIFGVSPLSIIKTNKTGELEWDKSFSGGYKYYCKPGQQTKDGGFIISRTTTDKDISITKLDNSGNIAWERIFSFGSMINYVRSVQQTGDGGYIIIGWQYQLGFSNSDNMLLIKTDGTGNILWVKWFDNGRKDQGHYVQQTSDGGYILTGSSMTLRGDGFWDYDIWLIKTDSEGNEIWNKKFDYYPTTFLEEFGVMGKETSDGGYILSYSHWYTDANIGIIKTDWLGNEIWKGSFYSPYVQPVGTNEIILTGSTGSGLILEKRNYMNDTIWTRTYGLSSEDQGYCAQQTQDGGYVIVGHNGSIGGIWLIKTDSEGFKIW